MAVDALARALAAGKVPVDAYQMAVAGGYTGTKEQFEEDMGNSATNATNAANSAAAAAASETAALAAATNFAPAYSSSATYAVGDHVLYNGGYYVCNTAITTAEAWTAAHWTAAKVGPEITDLKTQINGAEVDITSVFSFVDSKRIKYDTGVYQGGSSYSSYKANQNFVEVDGYQYLKITLPERTGSSGNGLAFYTSNSEASYISGVQFPLGESSGTQELTIPIPLTAKYVRTTYWSSSETPFSCKKIIVGINERLADIDDDLTAINPLNESVFGTEETVTSKFTFTDSASIRVSDGVYVSATGFKATQNFIDIGKYDLLRITLPSVSSSTSRGMAFYSSASESAFISGVLFEVSSTGGVREVIIPVPQNAKYIRATYLSSTETEFACTGIIVGNKEMNGDLYGKRANIINDLKTGNSENVTVLSGTYGGANATYAININKTSFRLAVDFQITEDVNAGDTATNVMVASVQGNTAKTLTLTKQKPNQFFGSFQSSDNTYYQALLYQSGFTCNGTTLSRTGGDTSPLVGKNAFSLWLQGSYAETEMPMADLLTREAWLNTYQDLAIVIENDELSMIRDGIGTDGNEYNDGATSTMFTVSLKSNGEYKTLRALYEELTALQETYHFVLKFDDLSYRKTCADLLQFGKMKLVGKYKQQIDTSGSTTAYYCDSYPCYFPFAVDETWHTLEIVKNGSTLYMAVDGRCAVSSFAGKVNEVILDGRAVTFSKLEVNLDGSFGDAEVFSTETAHHNALISSRSPYIVPLMGHDMITTYQGSGVIPGNNAQQQSLTRVEDIILYAQKKGYTIVSLDQFHDMWVGRTPMPKRVAFFILDDMRVSEAYLDLRNRSVVTRNGATLNFATINRAYDDPSTVDSNFKMFTSMRANGWCCASHSYRHDVRFGEKNSVIFVWELKKIMQDADNLNWLNDVIVANGAGGTRNQYNVMSAEGFCIVFHNDGYYDTRQNNPMKIGRTNIGDNTTGTSPYSILI